MRDIAKEAYKHWLYTGQNTGKIGPYKWDVSLQNPKYTTIHEGNVAFQFSKSDVIVTINGKSVKAYKTWGTR